MSAYNKHIQEFLQTACTQIRFKSIHKSIVNELTDHIEEQKSEYINRGLDEETATIKAVEQMGDPVLVGKQLDKAHRPRTEWFIISLAVALVVIGGAVQFFLSRVNMHHSDMFSRFLVYAPIGIAAFVFTYFFDYTLIGRYSKLAYFTLFAATIIGFLLLDNVRGAYVHVYYSVLLFIPVYAGIIYGFRNKGYVGIAACGLFYGGAAVLCIIAPRLTGLVVLTISCLILLTIAIKKGYFGGNRKLSLAMVYIPVIMTLIMPIFYFIPQYRRARFAVMINPELDAMGAGYQHFMIKRIFAASQPFGEAVLEGNIANRSIEQILPGWATDFSLTYIIGRLGYVVGFAIVAVVFVLIVRMFVSVFKQKNAFGFLVSCAACMAIAAQFVLYVLCNIGVLAPVSVTLPFISFGGMGFVVNMILVGIVLSVYRRTDIVVDRLHRGVDDRRLFTFEDGKLIIDLGLVFLKKMG